MALVKKKQEAEVEGAEIKILSLSLGVTGTRIKAEEGWRT